MALKVAGSSPVIYLVYYVFINLNLKYLLQLMLILVLLFFRSLMVKHTAHNGRNASSILAGNKVFFYK